MNIIFLDVDGVLNSVNKLIEVYNKTHKPHSLYNYPFDERCLMNLQLLVRETNSKLVIISSWRKSIDGRSKLMRMLKEYNLEHEVIGFTSNLNTKVEEIKEYLSKLDYSVNFIILDDKSNMEDLSPYLVNINSQVGLTEENVNEAILKLNNSFVRKLNNPITYK